MSAKAHSCLPWRSMLLIVACAAVVWSGVPALDAAGFRAGVAVRIVTPDPLLPVSGGVGPSHAAQDQRGELTVRALVLERDDTRVAIVSVDFLGFPAVLVRKVCAEVPGIPAANVLIGATHTHSAPDCYAFPDAQGRTGADLAYIDRVCRDTAHAINDAVAQLAPAELRIATGEARGRIAYNYYAEQLYDPRCDVIQIRRAGGSPLATLVNYAIHPEVLGSEAGLLSPDLIGPLYDRLAERGAGVGLFMNSAQGGMVTADNRGPDGQDRRTWDECLRIGRLLADEALRIVEGADWQVEPRLACYSRVIELPVDSPEMRFIMQHSPLGYSAPDATTVSTRLNLVNLGDAQILTIPGEALPNLGYYLKRKMHGAHNLLFGLTNDAFGYLMSKYDWRSFKRYDYISRVCLGEMTGEIYVAEALRLVDDSPAPAQP